jgi:hypothetical protein
MWAAKDDRISLRHASLAGNEGARPKDAPLTSLQSLSEKTISHSTRRLPGGQHALIGKLMLFCHNYAARAGVARSFWKSLLHLIGKNRNCSILGNDRSPMAYIVLKSLIDPCKHSLSQVDLLRLGGGERSLAYSVEGVERNAPFPDRWLLCWPSQRRQGKVLMVWTNHTEIVPDKRHERG